jgi:hypothetical protein
MSYLGQYLGSTHGTWWGYIGTEPPQEAQVSGGSAGWSGKREKYKSAEDIISEVLSEFSENKHSEVYEKAAYKEVEILKQNFDFINALAARTIPQDRNFITYEQLLALRYELSQEYLRLKQLLEEDDLIVALYMN